MPNAPVESEVITISPNIQVISPDGQTTQLTVPDITVTVPVLSMTVSEPATDVVNATFDNSPIPIIGQVNNYDGETAVFINDQQVYVDSTGMFTSSYTPVATVSTQPTATPEAAATTGSFHVSGCGSNNGSGSDHRTGSDRSRSDGRRCNPRSDGRRRNYYHRSAQEQLRDRPQGDHS